MNDVFLFPGQGSEVPGMGGAALQRPGPVRALLERASRAVGQDLAAVVTRGGPDLARTELGQPALVAISIGLALESGLTPSAVAGHSVGELAAFCLAGCLEPEEAIDCVVERARLMAQAARGVNGAMAAVRAGSEDEVREAMGKLEIAAHNAPEEWVLTGDRAALGTVAAKLAIVLLPVSGPWHSRAMGEAAKEWRTRLAQVQWKRPRVPLVANATGVWVEEREDLAQLLAGQLTGAVQWARTMSTLAGASAFHVFGPGRVLRGLCRANLGTAISMVLHDGEAAAAA